MHLALRRNRYELRLEEIDMNWDYRVKHLGLKVAKKKNQIQLAQMKSMSEIHTVPPASFMVHWICPVTYLLFFQNMCFQGQI